MKTEEPKSEGPKAEERLEADGRDSPVVQIGAVAWPIKEETDEGLQLGQEVQWQEFLMAMASRRSRKKMPQGLELRLVEDTQEFQASFKGAAVANQDHRDELGTQALADLGGEASEAYESMGPSIKVKEEIVDGAIVSLEVQHQRVRQFHSQEPGEVF